MNRPRFSCTFAWLTGTILIGTSAHIRAQEPAGHAPHGFVRAVRTAVPPAIDGRLVDDCWTLAAPVRGFTQIDPDEGQPATEETEIRVPLRRPGAVRLGTDVRHGRVPDLAAIVEARR
jgi:hypothetical protein